MSADSSSRHHPFGFSQVTGNPSFRSSAVNAVAVIPLLSSHKSDSGNNAGANVDSSVQTGNNSAKSFHDLWSALSRHNTAVTSESLSSSSGSAEELLLVVGNNQLTRPSDWKYQETPLKAFHWQEGCQRLHLFDGRPEQSSRLAQDRLLNPSVTRDWIDLCASRRTAAVIGVLNIRDCKTQEDWQRAQEELHQWATQRYATPPYQVTAHGQLGIERDQPVERLFVFDSFDEDCQHIDLSQTTASSSSILAFPPSDTAHSEMMDLHLNVVVNDLAVAIFRNLESRIRMSDDLVKADGVTSGNANKGSAARAPISRYVSGGSNDNLSGEEAPPSGSSTNLSLANMAELVSPANKLAHDTSGLDSSSSSLPGSAAVTPPRPPRTSSTASATNSASKPSTAANLRRMSGNQTTPPQLLTPMDDYYEWSTSQLSNKDAEALKRRDMARREKLAADLSLLAGSPLDAYERYLKAAHLSKTHPDPLWYAMALVGCASAHIAMAEAGGYNVDEYLENNFSLPDDILTATGSADPNSATGKQTLPEVVFALCEEASDILNRHARLAPFHAGLLLQLALYTAESAESHLRCRWGEGPGSFSGGESAPFRWEKGAAATANSNANLKTKDGKDMVDINVINRTKTICELLQRAVSAPDLDHATRLDIATRSARLCLEGIPGTKWKETSQDRIQLPRKAAFFTVVAAETMSSMNTDGPNPVLENLWLLACQLYTRRPNEPHGATDELGSYAWATLRASTLSALSLQGTSHVCMEASEMLLTLLEEIKPQRSGEAMKVKPSAKGAKGPSTMKKTRPPPVDVGSSHGSDMDRSMNSVDNINGEETYTEKAARMFRESFNQATGASSLLAVQSKWATEAPKKALEVPLSDQSPNILALKCVWSEIEHSACATAQKECAERIKSLKRGLSSSTSSVQSGSVLSPAESVSVPLSVSSSWSLQSYDGNFEIQLVKRKLEAKVDKGAMATFYNPFEKSGKEQAAMPVAAEEERVITLQFSNALAIPLAVRQCQLDFSEEIISQVNSAPVSFVLPPQAKDHLIQFPFTLASLVVAEASIEFELKGVTFTSLNQKFSLPLTKAINKDPKITDMPKPAVYSYLPAPKIRLEDEEAVPPKMELLPCQPRIEVRQTDNGSILDLKTNVVLGVTEGEVLSTPAFDLVNDSGPKGLGVIERLQIFVLGIAGGASEKMIYDSSDKSKDESVLPEKDFLEDMSKESPPLVKVRLRPGTSLDLSEINASKAEAQTVVFQLAVASTFRQKVQSKNTDIMIRLRYAGKPTASKEVWRKYDIPFTLSYFRGPRVVSVSFRPDLTEQKPIPQLLQSLQERRSKTTKAGSAAESTESNLSRRVGLDMNVQTSGSGFVAILTVLNDSSVDILLSRPNGATLGTFASKSLKELVVPKGVKVSIPLSIPRLLRHGGVGFAADIIKAASLEWRSSGSPSNSVIFARGNMSMREEMISKLIASTPSVIPSIFEPPCTIALRVDGAAIAPGFSATVAPAQPIEIEVNVSISSWISPEILASTEFTVELFTVKLEKTLSSPAPRDHIWSGLVKRRFSLDEMKSSHSASVVLLVRGTYALSACARFSQGSGGDEVWWAPTSASITCDPSLL